MSNPRDSKSSVSADALHQRFKPMLDYTRLGKSLGVYPYFKVISQTQGTEVEIEGRRLIMIGCNDYLGLAHHPLVKEAACRAIQEWGTGTGGSRFLCGNLALHELLEERLADWVGKKRAVVHATGFTTNLGALSSLLTPADHILCDRECHASILDGGLASRARLTTFAHNNPESLARKLDRLPASHDNSFSLLITEGVFSMSGDIAPLDQLVTIKKRHPGLLMYLDDAHGLGVMGPGGKGTAAHFGCGDDVGLIMGTFSKALGSIGGFVAGDDLDLLGYIRHTSRHLIFSAALPAASVATVLACLDLLQREPDRVERLWAITGRVRQGLAQMGLAIGQSNTPIIPIIIGDGIAAATFSTEFFHRGVFAPPAVPPAVPQGKALVRTAFMSTHSDAQIERVLEVISDVVRKMGVAPVTAS